MDKDIQTLNAVMGKVNELAIKMGLGADEIFGWYVSQIYVNIGLSLAFVVGFIALAGVGYIATRHWLVKEKKAKELEDFKKSAEELAEKTHPMDTPWELSDVAQFFYIISFFGAFVSVIVTIVHMTNLFNVKYHAFNNLLDKLSVLF